MLLSTTGGKSVVKKTRKLLDDVRISHKIAALVVMLGIICVGVALDGGLQLTRTGARYAVLTDRKGPALVALAGAERANYQMAYGAAMVIVYPGASEEGRAWARSVTGNFRAGSRFLSEARGEMPERQSEIADLENRLQSNKVKLDEAVELALFDRRAEAATALTKADPQLVAFGDSTRRLIDQGVREHRTASLELAASSTRTKWFLLFISIAGVILAAAGSIWMASEAITKPLARLRDHMQTLASGDNDVLIEDQDRGDEVGSMARAVQVFKDNALELKRSERERVHLQEARLRADAANQAKRDFLAIMSHELRTPLNGVLSMAHLMARGQLDAGQRQKLDVIQNSGQDLLHVINDILDFSKIEAGKLELESVVFDLEAMLEALHANFLAVAEGKGLTLRVEVAPEARGLRRGDPARLHQIINNFVSNALKFTERGEVVILAEGVGKDGGEALTLAVRDTGPGIPSDKMPLLFKSFSQLDASTTRQFGGTGLGLAICRELATLMGGRVWVENGPAVGAVFYATVSVPRVGEAATAREQDPQPVNRRKLSVPVRVLAAEDNPTNQKVLSAIMETFGFELNVANNGREAVEAWGGGGFDVILMDIQMPEMDGIASTRLIREAEAQRGLPRTPIIALTANALRHQVDEYAAAGMDDHLAKPIVIPLLLAALERVLSGREGLASTDQAGSDAVLAESGSPRL
jgi:signal transduction histidine kinase/CheY-like chemotaxis protein